MARFSKLFTFMLQPPRTVCYHVLVKPKASGGQTVVVSGISNQEFIETHARAGRVGLSGGETMIDNAICWAERHVHAGEHWGAWSHAFIFQGRRVDGHHWVIESDLQIHRKHIRLGVQENRAAKYYDEDYYGNLAILDFGLTEVQVAGVLNEALELVAGRSRYSVRELLGTLIALRHSTLRGKGNLMARESSLFCSAFVRHLYRKCGLDLVPGVDVKNTTPEDIARTLVPHTAWVLQRTTPESQLARLRRKIKGRLSQAPG